MDYDGKVLQILNEGVSLKELLHPKFVETIDDEFENMNIYPVNLTFILERENEIPVQITLLHKNHLQRKEKKLIIDVDEAEYLEIMVKSVNEMKNND